LADRKLVPIHYTILIRIFEHDGFRVVRQKGDHLVLTKAGVPRPLVIKTSPMLVPVTHIRTNMTTAGMTRERYFEILDEVG
jgi:predicted RNA binding protein YcfA (HicA-like mRNA interferase family)